MLVDNPDPLQLQFFNKLCCCKGDCSVGKVCCFHFTGRSLQAVEDLQSVRAIEASEQTPIEDVQG